VCNGQKQDSGEADSYGDGQEGAQWVVFAQSMGVLEAEAGSSRGASNIRNSRREDLCFIMCMYCLLEKWSQ